MIAFNCLVEVTTFMLISSHHLLTRYLYIDIFKQEIGRHLSRFLDHLRSHFKFHLHRHHLRFADIWPLFLLSDNNMFLSHTHTDLCLQTEMLVSWKFEIELCDSDLFRLQISATSTCKLTSCCTSLFIYICSVILKNYKTLLIAQGNRDAQRSGFPATRVFSQLLKCLDQAV